MKWWQLFCVLMVSLSVNACSTFNKMTTSQPSKTAFKWQGPAASKMVIYTGGNALSLVITHSPLLQVSFLTNHTNPNQVQAVMKAGVLTLYVHENAALQRKKNVIVTIPDNLQQLTVIGKGALQANALPTTLQTLTLKDNTSVIFHAKGWNVQRLQLDHVKQALLDGLMTTATAVSVHDCGPVALNGTISLSELQVADSSLLAISWLNSQQLTVELRDHQRLYLAGVAKLLIARVDDHARLEATYLRSQKAFINTKQQAMAAITVLDSLNAYAQADSNIYYYQQPTLAGRYFQGHGSILFMGVEPPPCLEPQCARMPESLPG